MRPSLKKKPETISGLIIMGCGLIILAHLTAMMLGLSPQFSGELWHINWDPDAYSRILRVLRLHETGRWYDPTAPYYNAPYGLEMHWSRLLDILLYPGAWVGSLFTSFDTALEVWSTLFLGPFLHLLYVPVLVAAIRQLAPPHYLLLAILMLLSCSQLFAVHRPGFIDYHGLLALLFFLQQVLLLIALVRPSAMPMNFLWIGITSALGVWLSVESLMLSTALLLAIIVIWIFDSNRMLYGGVRLAWGFVSVITVALAIERPPGDWLTVEYDRLSILHVFIGLVMLILAMSAQQVCDRWRIYRPLARTFLGLPLLVLGAGALIGLFPGLTQHPQQDIGPLVTALLDSQPGEQPYFSQRWGEPAAMLWEIGPWLLVFPYTLFQLIRCRGRKQQRFIFYMVMLVSMLAYLSLRGRALPFFQVCTLLPWVELARDAFSALQTRIRNQRAFVRGLTATSATAALFFHLIAFALVVPWDRIKASPSPCNYGPLKPILATADAEGTVLAPMFEGPQLVYETGLPVISSPYHRNRDGIEEGFELMWMNADLPQVRQIAEKRQLKYVVLCRIYPESDPARLARQPRSLVSRLAKGSPPSWLKPVELPEAVNRQFLVYESVMEPDKK